MGQADKDSKSSYVIRQWLSRSSRL